MCRRWHDARSIGISLNIPILSVKAWFRKLSAVRQCHCLEKAIEFARDALRSH
jgi:hypothetical protein